MGSEETEKRGRERERDKLKGGEVKCVTYFLKGVR